ncbi:MAG: hypothetical protein M3Q19_14600 [Pseudomonadota bacterium]|nr:hypothetical protein [Pseudomonadota bacterium]
MSVAYPVGIQAGDIAIIHALVVDSLNDNSLNVPNGFTQIEQVPLFSEANTSSAAGIFWRRLNGSESGSVSVTTAVSTEATDTLAAGMSVWRGCVAAGNPFEALATARANNTSMTGSAVTTSGANRRVLHFCATYSGASATPASGWTEEYDYYAPFGTGEGGLMLFSKERAAAGTESAAVHTLSQSRRWVTFALALIPA